MASHYEIRKYIINNHNSYAFYRKLKFGELLGSGASRSVYANLDPKHPNTVIKVETPDAYFGLQNMRERELYNILSSMHEKFYEQWFAKIYDVSPCGRVLIQERVIPLTDDDWDNHPYWKTAPDFPDWFNDMGPGNCGWAERDGKRAVVVCDYGLMELPVDWKAAFKKPKRSIRDRYKVGDDYDHYS